MIGMKRITPRKEPVQQRSKALRQSILQAAAYILEHEGPSKFTTNSVAERAGVNIASFYQYYPNKESLLFHLVELQWDKTYRAAYPILKNESLSHSERLYRFVHKFFEHEAKDRDLKDAMAHLGYFLEGTKEYSDLLKVGQAEFAEFLASQHRRSSHRGCAEEAEFVLHTITSFSECKRAGRWLDIKKDAQIMSQMICSNFIKKA